MTSYALKTLSYPLRFFLCASMLIAVACDDEPAYPGPPTKPKAEVKGADEGDKAKKPDAKKPATQKPAAKSGKVNFDLKWSGEIVRSDSDHITGRMKLATRTINVTADEVADAQNAKDLISGFCDAVKKTKLKVKCAKPDGDTQGLDIVALTASVLTDPVALKKVDKDKKPKGPKVKSAANTSVGGLLSLNEGAEHFRFRLKFRATSPSADSAKGWWTALGASLADEWSTRLVKRLAKRERNLKPSSAIQWVAALPESWQKDVKPFRYHFTTMLTGGHVLICYGVKGEPSEGRSCASIDPNGKVGDPVRFAMGELGEHERRARQSWTRPSADKTRLFAIGDGFVPAVGDAPKPPLEDARQNVWIAQVEKEGGLSLATVVPDFFPHSPAIHNAQGHFFFAAWGVKELELIQWNPETKAVDGRWPISEVVDNYDLIWLDAKTIAILPEGSASIYALDITNARARLRKLWTWPSGKSPAFDDNNPHATSDGAGGLLILTGSKDEPRAAYRVSNTGKTLWSIRLGTSPAFNRIVNVGDNAALIGEELKFINIARGEIDASDARDIKSITPAAKGVTVACGKPGLIAYKDLKRWREVRIKGSCDHVSARGEGFVAVQGTTAIGVGPVSTWDTP